MPQLNRVICKIKDRCISNGYPELMAVNPSAKLTFDKVYQLYEMQMVRSDVIQVFIDDNGAYRTYSLYKHCFMSA